jgi:hypothetical protein
MPEKDMGLEPRGLHANPDGSVTDQETNLLATTDTLPWWVQVHAGLYGIKSPSTPNDIDDIPDND